MISADLAKINVFPQNGEIRKQLDDLGFQCLGEANGWAEHDPRWEQGAQCQEVYSTPHGYHLYADIPGKLYYFTHSGD